MSMSQEEIEALMNGLDIEDDNDSEDATQSVKVNTQEIEELLSQTEELKEDETFKPEEIDTHELEDEVETKSNKSSVSNSDIEKLLSEIESVNESANIKDLISEKEEDFPLDLSAFEDIQNDVNNDTSVVERKLTRTEDEIVKDWTSSKINEGIFPLPAEKDTKVVNQLSQVANDSEEKVSQIFDVLSLTLDNNNEFRNYIKDFEVFIKAQSELLISLKNRLEFFHQVGCRVSDHALDPPAYLEGTEEELEAIFAKKMNGLTVSTEDVEKFKTAIMVFLAKEYSKKGWVMQLHMGTRRNNNTRMYNKLGADTGFDTIADYSYIEALAKFMDKLDSSDELPKTILYTLNPKDNEALGTLIGCFQGGGIPGKIQFGSGWWFNDQKDGMIRQMTALGNLGLLSRFVGMLTDSRSFLSYTRHEYFRRILCNLIGQWVENGEAPEDYKLLGNMVQNICFNNASNYFYI